MNTQENNDIPLTQLLTSESTLSQNNNISKTKTKNNFNKIKKIFVLTLIFSIVLSLIPFIFYVTNLDVLFVNIQLEGLIIDKITNKPIENVSIQLKSLNKEVSTNEKGVFLFHNINFGTIKASLKKEGYIEKEVDIVIFKEGFDYKTETVIDLIPKELATVKGSFKFSGEHDYFDENLKINETKVSIKKDGTYETILPVGEANLELSSNRFKSIKRIIKIDTGINEIEPIELKLASHIEADVFDYITEKPLKTIDIIAERVLSENIIKDLDNKRLKIRDLEINKEYSIRVSSPGYITKTYKLLTKEGLNIITDFNMVPTGEEFFFTTNNQRNSIINLSKTNLDGSEFNTIVTLDKDIYPINVYFDIKNNTGYFTSIHENINNIFNGEQTLPYTIDLSSGIINRLFYIQDEDLDVSKMWYNLKADTALKITQVSEKPLKYILEISNLSGKRNKKIKDFTSNISEVIISNSGDYIYLVTFDKKDSAQTLTQINVNTLNEIEITQGNSINLMDVDITENKIIYSKIDPISGFSDIHLYNAKTFDDTVLIEKRTGFDYQFDRLDSNKIYFIDTVNNDTNIFLYNVSEFSTSAITDLGTLNPINNIFQSNNRIFYENEDGLFVFDPLSPVDYKKVIDKDIID